MDFSSDSGLLIVGHGSTVNPDSSASTWAHAQEIERRGIFAEVSCAFWKEEPSLRDALFSFDPNEIKTVYVVPNFISEGYFTQRVIPRELELTGKVTTRAAGQVWRYCEPVGSNPVVTDLLLARAKEIAPKANPRETALLIVAHGTELNDNSAVAAKREVERIRRRDDFAEVHNVYMEEAPRVADWYDVARQPNVIVVPFFVSDGLHSYEDIPRLLGIDTQRGGDFSGEPHRVRGRALFYGSAIGTDPRFAEAIVEQARNAASVAYAG